VAPVDRKVIDTITDIGHSIPLADGTTLSASALAERFGFDDQLQHASVRRLSGGERRRLALLHLLVAAPNVLVLDEPTNDLDLDTLAALEHHLDGFAGTIVVASHDRYLLDRLTDRIVAVEDGRAVEYLDWDHHRRTVEARHDRDEPAAPVSDTAVDNRRRQEQRKEVRALEQRMQKLTRRRDELHGLLAAAGADLEQVRELDAERRTVEDELGEVEERWLELTIS
jgi:ABC transport system ATP-binding/permease protein